jgi:cyclophilin family peptidyl-prolyl cis-trans isomerase/lysophospholipase L1-like esterase
MKTYFSAGLLFAAILAANAGQAVITAGPNDLTNNAGSTANFTVTATNATSYQWTFQGANIPGATNPQYIIQDTATNQAGVYSVIVGGSTGSNLTNSATLTVLQGTIINFQISGFASSSGAWQKRLAAAVARTKTLTVYGDSITAGFFDTQTNVNWPYLVASNNNWTLFDLAIPGSKIGDVSTNIAFQSQTNAGGGAGAMAIMYGINDYIGDTSLTNTNAFAAALMADILWYELGTNLVNYSNPGMAYTGSFGSNLEHPFCVYAVDSNATAGTTVYGSAVAICAPSLGGTGIGWAVTIDGTNFGNITQTIPLFNSDEAIFYNAYLYTNLPLTWHTVTLTSPPVQWGGTAAISYIAGIDSALPTAPLVIVNNIIPPVDFSVGGTAAELASYNATVLSVCQQLDNAGLPVIMCDVSSACAAITNQYVAPPLHPGNPGEAIIAQTDLDALSNPTYVPSMSNVLVELFDHDKPATVQNFIHYVQSEAYNNMFFDRLIPGFVLQGGGWFAQDQTNTTPPPSVANIFATYAQSFLVNNPSLPEHVNSEYYVGPQVSNTKGTLAMALPAGDADGATCAFFFNLVDNTNLDTTNSGGGPFTVFGRVLSGANVLDYFNNTNEFFKRSFTNIGTNDIFTNGIFDADFYDPGYAYLTDLPVNFHGTNQPADTNLFFVEFSYPDANAQPVIDTNLPTAAISFPAPGALLTNGVPVTAQGTAHDDVGLAMVYCTLSSGGNFVPEVVAGTANWSVPLGLLPPGSYNLLVTPQDGAGNEGSLVIQSMLVSAVFTNGLGTVSATNLSTSGVLSDAVGASLADGTTYALGAHPGPGQFFVNWTTGTNIVTVNPELNIYMTSNFFITANFSSNSPAGGIAFTYPSLGGYTTNGNFSIRGLLTGLTNTPVTVKCQLYSYTNFSPVGKLMVTNGITNWSFHVTNLPLGHYLAEVSALDNSGNTVVISNAFTAGLPFTILTNGNGNGSITASFSTQKLVPGQTYYAAEGQSYWLKAAPASGSLFESWFDGSIYTNNATYRFIMVPGLASPAATFVSNDFPVTVSSPILFTFPASGARLTTQDFTLKGTISPALTNPVVTYQLFYGSNSATPPANTTITPAATRTSRPTWSIELAGLAPGYYDVAATVSDTNGRSTMISEKFQVLAQLSFQIDPPGSGRLSSNWTSQYVPVGTTCTITAETNGGYVFAYWSNSAFTDGYNLLKFKVATNYSIAAHFASNYYYSGAGTYHGLFFPSASEQAVTAVNSGYYTFMVTSNGGVSLKLGFPAFTNAGSGNLTLYTDGSIQFQLAWADQVTNYVNLNLTNGYLDGYVASPNFYANLQAFRAAPKLTSNSAVIPGTNVFTIPGNHGAATNNQPGGDGYASFTLGSSGAATLIGHLADNTAFSESTQVATNYLITNAVWPFYAPIYGGKGVILGWLTNTSPSNYFGLLVWSKPLKTGSWYTNGIEMLITNASSASFVPPVKGSQYQIAFGGASLTNGFTNTLAFTTSGVFTNLPGGQAPKLLVTLNSKSGALTGSFTPPSGKGTNKIYGAFTSPTVGGSGYFLDTNSQTGFFEINEIR